MVEFVHGDWTSGPVLVARGFRDRLLGIHRAGRAGVVLRTSSVHTFWMRSPLGVVALDASDVVLRAAWVRPFRVCAVRGAVSYLELPQRRVLPPNGARLWRRPIVIE